MSAIIINAGATASGKTTSANEWLATDPERRRVVDEGNLPMAIALADAGFVVMLNVCTEHRFSVYEVSLV